MIAQYPATLIAIGRKPPGLLETSSANGYLRNARILAGGSGHDA
jgi:hypothetical protein